MVTTTGTKRAVGYCRVSTTGQTGERHSSLETQQDRFRQHCSRMGYTPVGMFTDVMSGRRDDRREYQQMLDYVGQGNADVIVVQWLDRFGRHPKEILSRFWALQEQGVTVEATDEDLKEELILLIKAGLAGAESRKISERVRANMGRAVGKGVHVGRAPYGLKPIKTIVGGKVATTWELDPLEAPVVREMFRLSVVENRGFKGIADSLNATGYRNRSRQPWGAWAIRQILCSEHLMGNLLWGKKGMPEADRVRLSGFFPPILSTDEWQSLQERLSIRREHPKGKGQVSTYLLSGIARCGACGSSLSGKTGTQRSGKHYQYYVCVNEFKGKGRCPGFGFHSARKVEAAVLEYLSQLEDPETFKRLVAEAQHVDTAPLKDDLARAEKRLAKLDTDFMSDMQRVHDGTLNDREFALLNEARRQERDTLSPQVASLKARVDAAEHQSATAEALPVKVKSFLEDFQAMPVQQAKAQLQLILKAVHVYRDGRVELEFRQ